MRQRLRITKSLLWFSRLHLQKENTHSFSKKCKRYFQTLSMQFINEKKNDHVTTTYDLATVETFCQLRLKCNKLLNHYHIEFRNVKETMF